jgi:flagellar hook protein FlgE
MGSIRLRGDWHASCLATAERITQAAATLAALKEIPMSLFGALNTAVSGLSAESSAFGNISDNVANSQTVGFKGVGTNFTDYLTTSTTEVNQPGAVATTPDYTNTVQGTVTQSTDPLALAISGQGFFAVSEQTGKTNTNQPIFSNQTYYTRAGDFTMDKNGYLVNSAGEFLQGWAVNPTTGAVNQSQLETIQVNQAQFDPVATSQVTISANLPAAAASGTTATSTVDVYDTQGAAHQMSLNWAATGTANQWTLTISDGGGTVGTATVTFGSDGTLSSVVPASNGANGSVTADNSYTGAAGSSAVIDFSPSDVSTTGGQPIQLNLGTLNSSDGVTQFAASQYSLRNVTQNGVPPGSFTGISMDDNGNVIANYDNGQSQTIANIPLVTFRNADALQRQNGQAFTATNNSGTAIAQAVGNNGAGTLVAGSVESSNVDIATEFSKLIVAQQAYGANAKMITSANQMLQTTIDMKQ